MIRFRKLAIAIAVLALAACSATHPPAPNLPPRTSITPGQTISVDGSQTVYSIARQYNVSMREIIVLNNLQPPFTLRPGQSLVLPGGASDTRGMAPSPIAAPSAAIEQTTLPPPAASSVQAVPLPPPPVAPKQDQTQVNAIAPAPFTASVVGAAPAAPVSPPVKPVPTTATPSTVQPAPQAAAPQAVAPPQISMVWPVQGPVLSDFGPKGQGLNNDGVNIGAPKGTPVVAALNGIVVYAGNEMKGFGNLILIRHKDGWVTAYAHLDRMVVAKDAVVGQGDMIGTVGKTGNVPSPQLHFETRYQGKPVDPSTVIKAD